MQKDKTIEDLRQRLLEADLKRRPKERDPMNRRRGRSG